MSSKTGRSDETPSRPWVHPIHARGVRSMPYDSTVKGALSDAAILRYALAGYYGEVTKRNAEILMSRKKNRSSEKKRVARLVEELLDDLDD